MVETKIATCIVYMTKVCLLYGHFGLSIIHGVFLDHIGGVQTGLRGYFIILSGFMVQNIHKYVKVDHDGRNQNIVYMTKVCLLCGHFGLSTIPGVFLDHIGGVQTDLCGYFIILSGFIVPNIRKYAKVDHDGRNQNITCTIKV